MQEYPLHAALRNNNFLEVKRLIEEEKIDINSFDDKGITPLILGAQKTGPNTAKYLIQHGAQVNLVSNNPDTISPLWAAARNGSSDTVELLIKSDANVHFRAGKNLSVLHTACYKGNVKSVEVLLAKGVDINAKDDFNRTPLYWAALNGHADVVEFLLSKQAQVDLETIPGNTALGAALLAFFKLPKKTEQAVVERFKKTITTLVNSNATAKYGDKNDKRQDHALYLAVNFENVDSVTQLLTNPNVLSNINEKTQPDGFTAFWRAAQKGNVEIMRLLLAQNADPSIANPNNGMTPLMMAVRNGHLDAVKFLIEVAKVSTQTVDKSEFSILHLAAQYSSNIEVLDYLLKRNNIDINSQDNLQCTPLHLAVYNDNLAGVQKLVAAGADLFIPDTTGQPAFLYANITPEINECLNQAREKFKQENPNVQGPYSHWPSMLPVGEIITDNKNECEMHQYINQYRGSGPVVTWMLPAPQPTHKPYEFVPDAFEENDSGISITISTTVNKGNTSSSSNSSSSQFGHSHNFPFAGSAQPPQLQSQNVRSSKKVNETDQVTQQFKRVN